MVRKMSSTQVFMVAGVNHDTPRIFSSSGEQLRGRLEQDVARKARLRLKGSSSSDGLEVGVDTPFLDGPATTSISESEFVRLVLDEEGPDRWLSSSRSSSFVGSDIFFFFFFFFNLILEIIISCFLNRRYNRELPFPRNSDI